MWLSLYWQEHLYWKPESPCKPSNCVLRLPAMRKPKLAIYIYISHIYAEKEKNFLAALTSSKLFPYSKCLTTTTWDTSRQNGPAESSNIKSIESGNLITRLFYATKLWDELLCQSNLGLTFCDWTNSFMSTTLDFLTCKIGVKMTTKGVSIVLCHLMRCC